jgi:1,2-phenylacetyl-CoA epoxidase PaaB subunit
MSKIREHFEAGEGELGPPPEGDLRPFVAFTRLREDGPFVYAGWVDAADAAMALDFARQHYGRDQECVAIWVVPRSGIVDGDDVQPGAAGTGTAGAAAPFQVFVFDESAGMFQSAEEVAAAGAAAALELARAAHPEARIWVVRRSDITATGPDELIWRLTDQSYRLARGYSKDVREKWERVRNQRAIEAYEREDLKDAF